MVKVYVTIDTEYSSGLFTGHGEADRADNYARSIACLTPGGPCGLSYKLQVLKRYGQKAVFFVDPMPALVWGVASIEDVVAPILEAGQDVQLHCHCEWLAHAGSANPLLSKRIGHNLFDFPFEEQCELLTYARDTLIAAGAPAPVAFRAGNYGANDDTLGALAEIGIGYDSSHCPALLTGASRITLGPEHREPVMHEGVIEVPVGSIGTHSGGQRHAQITAITLAEMKAAISHARDEGRASFTLVSHSFELINRRKMAVNNVVRRRFAGLCSALRDMADVETGNYIANPPMLSAQPGSTTPLPANAIRTGMRYAEQLVSNTFYGAL